MGWAGWGHSKGDELSVHKGLYTLQEPTDQLSLGHLVVVTLSNDKIRFFFAQLDM